MDGGVFVILLVSGFLLARALSGSSEGVSGIVPSFRFRIRDYFIHIHHWIWSLAAIAVFFSFNWHHPALYGLASGICAQGLSYKDFYCVVYSLPAQE